MKVLRGGLGRGTAGDLKGPPNPAHPPSPLLIDDSTFQKPILESTPDVGKGRCPLHSFSNYDIDHMYDVKLITVMKKWAERRANALRYNVYWIGNTFYEYKKHLSKKG